MVELSKQKRIAMAGNLLGNAILAIREAAELTRPLEAEGNDLALHFRTMLGVGVLILDSHEWDGLKGGTPVENGS